MPKSSLMPLSPVFSLIPTTSIFLGLSHPCTLSLRTRALIPLYSLLDRAHTPLSFCESLYPQVGLWPSSTLSYHYVHTILSRCYFRYVFFVVFNFSNQSKRDLD
ncbi:hypothetical protein AMTRI_Chr07g30210 [Amborella trichopoda]